MPAPQGFSWSLYNETAAAWVKRDALQEELIRLRDDQIRSAHEVEKHGEKRIKYLEDENSALKVWRTSTDDSTKGNNGIVFALLGNFLCY